jgi:ferredoxin-type protein NapF
MAGLNRRGFFGFLATAAGATSVVRPPYASDPMRFGSQCPTCTAKSCMSACETRIIRIDDKGLPELDFSQNGCTYCDACRNACQSGVLENAEALIPATVRIDTQKCVSHFGVICFTCKEPCMDDAIIFEGLFKPTINTDRCTACGFCMARCPSNAITIIASGREAS